MDEREAFTRRVRAIDPLFKVGNLEAFWPELRKLMAMAPKRADVSQKKSHYLAGLAVHSLKRGDLKSAVRFLEHADRHVNPDHLTPFFRHEREEIRARVDTALHPEKGPRKPRPISELPRT